MECSEKDLKVELEHLMKVVNKAQKTLTIAIIGLHGSGKSSFLNTLVAVLRGEYHEIAHYGNFENGGNHVTHRFTRYPKEKYLDGSDEDLTLNWPIFEDMTGFQNTDHGKIRKLLDYIINGRIKDGAKLNTSLQNKLRDWVALLQQIYYGEESSAKVDRIIFVASARSKELPRELINALISQAMYGKIEVPIFGVLTHADKKDEINPDFERKFKHCLGLNDQRFLLCSNYCDDIPPQRKRNPLVEVPIARFLQQVMDPARHVFQEKRDFKEYFRRLIKVQLKDILYFICYLLITYIVLLFRYDDFYNFLYTLVLSKLFTSCFLWILVNCGSYDLNLTVGIFLKKILDKIRTNGTKLKM